MSLGFVQAGFKVVAAIDVSQTNVGLHKRNFPRTTTICQDVRRLTGASIRTKARLGRATIDVVFGGPPCQGFSIGGKQRVTDARNKLLLEFARIVTELKPRYFVMENVAGLLAKRYAPLVAKFKRVLRKGGYTIVEPVLRLDAVRFGVPQRRRRVFVLGHRKGVRAPSYPSPTDERVTVGAAIDDLKVAVAMASAAKRDSYAGRLGTPSQYASTLRRRGVGALTNSIAGLAVTEHSEEVLKRFKGVKPGGVDAISRFIRLARDGVAPTLRAGTGPENGRFMAPRPIHHDDARCITVREAARLHSFPDWFAFHETKWNGFMQIGNSVPPRLARAVASEIKRSLSGTG
jgi:DNA (cytosine-5)-methyltransferase 1